MKILIVEDDPIAVEIITSLLADEPYTLEVATSAQQAIQQATRISPDLILSDVLMEGMDGYDLTRLIRNTPAISEAPILLISSLDDPLSRLKAFDAGADDFITKPYDHLELRMRVRSILRLNRYRTLLIEREKLQEALESLEFKNEELKRLSHRITEIQEIERRGLALELHDEIGQNLTALKFMFNQLLPLPEEKLFASSQVQDLLQQLINSVRNVSQRLRPTALDDFGLNSALLGLLNQFSQQTGLIIKHNLSEFDETRYSAEIETAIYRITQEAINNTAKYAEAKTINIELINVFNKLTLKISDDGKGFIMSDILNKPSFTTGLSSMRERAHMANGYFQILSSPESGTQIIAEFTLEKK